CRWASTRLGAGSHRPPQRRAVPCWSYRPPDHIIHVAVGRLTDPGVASHELVSAATFLSRTAASAIVLGEYSDGFDTGKDRKGRYRAGGTECPDWAVSKLTSGETGFYAFAYVQAECHVGISIDLNGGALRPAEHSTTELSGSDIEECAMDAAGIVGEHV